MKHFFIIAGGKIEDAFAIEVLKGFAEKTVIAADSGMEFLRRNEIVPQVIIGDFDSVSKETLEWFQKKEGIVWHRLNPQKDDTDTEFALRLAISMGAECITVLGGTGSRLDHVLGNIELLGIGLELGVEIELLDANNRIRMTDHGMVLKKEEQFGKYVSLIPYTAQVEHLYLAGFKYPLADYCLKGFCSIGVSNEITEEQAEITFENGCIKDYTCNNFDTEEEKKKYILADAEAQKDKIISKKKTESANFYGGFRLFAKQLLFSAASVVVSGGLVLLLYRYIGLTGAAREKL